MVMTAQLRGREALMRRLNQLAPNIEKYAAPEKLKAAEELAEAIRARAPRGESLEYAESIDGDLLTSRPAQELVGSVATKDKTATGIFAKFIWRFLEFGTRSHIIKPKSGDRLIFEGADGELVSVKQVKHPGSAARPHIFPTYRAMKPKIRKRIRAAVNKAVREAMKK